MASMEVEAIDSGYLCEIRVPAGDTAEVGKVIAVLAETRDECR